MNYAQICKLQKDYGSSQLQGWINSGLAWQLEGGAGRRAMDALRSGECMLPLKAFKDYYGNRVPSRSELRSGTTGTYVNCKRYWSRVLANETYNITCHE